MGNKIAQVRTSIINGDVPLLLSKTVLGKLGMVFDIERGQADFNKVGLRGFDLLVTASGHPAIPIIPTTMDGDPSAFHAEDLKLVPKGEYVAFAVAHGAGPSKNPERYNFFYDKKLDPGVKDMLTRERLPREEYLAWWRTSTVGYDCWLETEHAWVRVHVTPRKALFNPSTWKTRASVQKEMLAQTAIDVRVTEGMRCTSGRWLETVVDRWQHDQINEPVFDFLWIGRTWIGKRQAPSLPLCTPRGYGTGAMQAAAHQPHVQDAAAGGGHPLGSDCTSQLGSHGDQGLYHGSQGSGKAAGSDGTDDHSHVPAGASHEGGRAQDRVRHLDYQGQSPPIDPRLTQCSRSRAHEDREVQRTPILRNHKELWRVDGEGAGESRQPRPRACEVWALVQAEAHEQGHQGLLQQRCATPIPELDRSDLEDGKPEIRVYSEGIVGPGGGTIVDGELEAKDPPGHRQREQNGGGNGPEGRCRDPGVGDQVGAVEGQGQGIGQQLDSFGAHNRTEDAGCGMTKGKILSNSLQGREETELCRIGGRKCCPELARDCFFTEEEFVGAYRGRHEINETGFGEEWREERHDYRDSSDDSDCFHDAMEDIEEAAVYECREFTLNDRIAFAYDSGDFSFATFLR